MMASTSASCRLASAVSFFFCFYLALDDSDNRPLVIDQPEENLDPKSVFDELVNLFIEAKSHRQVIMVTLKGHLSSIARRSVSTRQPVARPLLRRYSVDVLISLHLRGHWKFG
jgi:hypothetical protein